MSDNLQEIVDAIRKELREHGPMGAGFAIAHPSLKDPLVVEVTPDGVTAWLVKVTVGKRVLFDTGDRLCVHPDEFISGLYVFIRACIKAAIEGPPKPS